MQCGDYDEAAREEMASFLSSRIFSYIHILLYHRALMKNNGPWQEATAVLLEFLEVAVHQVL